MLITLEANIVLPAVFCLWGGGSYARLAYHDLL